MTLRKINVMQSFIKQLLKPRWFTSDLHHAESSPCQWKSADDGKGYTLSLLGAINTIATWFGICVVVIDGNRLRLKKVWWR